MTLIRYLLEYAIDVVCDGNRSDLARRIGMEYHELKRLRKRISEGAGSSQLAEALLEMFWREDISLDQALKDYTRSYMGADIETAERACKELADVVQSTIVAGKRKNTSNVSRMMSAAEVLMEQLEKYFCQDVCRRSDYLTEECPLKSYAAFLQRLNIQIQRPPCKAE